tara:strand:+ start:372 stop:1535 length:1164 start_codon:yes stop_codon:yes gene_type:complete
MKKIAIIAGELSADILGAEIISSVNSNVFWFGVGGPNMKSKGLHEIMDWNSIQAFGLGDIIIRIPKLFLNAYKLANLIIKEKPDIIFTVDTKGFNFFLINIIRKKIIKNFNNYFPRIIHIVAPTVWAWRPNRAKKLKNMIDILLCLFPKEPDYFTKHGIDAIATGHPAIHRYSKKNNRNELFKILKLKDLNQKIITLLPGSRDTEVKRNLPVLIQSVKIIRSKIKPNPLFIIQSASNQERIIKKIITSQNVEIKLVNNEKNGDLLTSLADFAVVTCGTATLEYCIAGVPSIAIYKTGYFSGMLGRLIIDMDKVVLPNWILDREIIQFLFQEKCNPEYISEFVIKNLYNPEIINEFKDASKSLKKLLKVNNKSFNENIEKVIMKTLKI